jgi:two-component system NtrC family sensor kinase
MERQVLLDDGFVVEACGTGAQAVAYLQDRSFDVIVDLAAPSGESFELFAAQRSDPAIADIPRVVAVDSGGMRGRGQSDVRLVRPFTSGDLRLAIERAMLERESRALRAELAESERLALLGRVAAGVGHELNNPLAFVLGNVELAEGALHGALHDLGGAAFSGASKRLDVLGACLRDARLGLSRMQRVVSELSLFSRRSSGQRCAVDVRTVLEASLSMARRQIDDRAVVTCRYGEPAFVLGDEARLGQLFLNLLVNAAQAIPPGNPSSHRIGIRTFQDGASVIIEVEDTGCGMSSAQVARIFEPFFTTKAPEKGTGLGLSICREIVKEHEGRLDVHSELGQGSRFTVRLPTLPRVISVSST